MRNSSSKISIEIICLRETDDYNVDAADGYSYSRHT